MRVRSRDLYGWRTWCLPMSWVGARPCRSDAPLFTLPGSKWGSNIWGFVSVLKYGIGWLGWFWALAYFRNPPYIAIWRRNIRDFFWRTEMAYYFWWNYSFTCGYFWRIHIIPYHMFWALATVYLDPQLIHQKCYKKELQPWILWGR
jgi:hypothetical protein